MESFPRVLPLSGLEEMLSSSFGFATCVIMDVLSMETRCCTPTATPLWLLFFFCCFFSQLLVLGKHYQSVTTTVSQAPVVCCAQQHQNPVSFGACSPISPELTNAQEKAKYQRPKRRSNIR